jgi:hypothetical protein
LSGPTLVNTSNVVFEVNQDDVVIQRSDWSHLVYQYRDITTSLNNAKNHSWDFIPINNSPAGITVANQYDCAVYPLQVQWKRGTLDKYRAYPARRIDIANQIDSEIGNVDAASAIADYLKTVMDKIVTIPDIGPKFTADWFSIAIDLPHALGDLRSALVKQKTDTSYAITDAQSFIRSYEQQTTPQALKAEFDTCKK